MQLSEPGRQIERLVVHGCESQAQRGFERGFGRLLLLVGEDHGIDTTLTSATRAAKRDWEGDQVLQLQRDVLDNMGQIGAAAQAFDKAARPTEAALVRRDARE